MILGAALSAISAAIVFFSLNKDYNKGLSWAIFFIILLPKSAYVYLEFISAHRIILLILYGNYILNYNYFPKRKMNSIFYVLILIFAFKVISALLSINSGEGLKKGILYLAEVIFFFYIMVQYPKNDKQILSVFKSIFYALSIVSILGMVEKYGRIRILAYLPYTESALGTYIITFNNLNNIFSTFIHPILFGVAMSIGWVLGFLLFPSMRKYKWPVWLMILFMFGNLYFSQSRGPWLASMLGIAILILYSPRVRKRLPVIMMISVAFLVFNPGVRESISVLVASTFDENSIEGASFSYRFEIWKQAGMLITRTMRSFLFGYGEEARNFIDLGQRASVTGHMMNFDSWDSEFAVLLLETGAIGLCLNLAASLTILNYLIKGLRRLENQNRDLILIAIINVLMINFMMTNVKIFAVQLWFIYWGLTALSIVLIDFEGKKNVRNMRNI